MTPLKSDEACLTAMCSLFLVRWLVSRHVHTFFHDYLTSQRNVSPHTLLSYRDAIKLFLQFGSVQLGKPVVELVIDELNVDLVLAFLNRSSNSGAFVSS